MHVTGHCPSFPVKKYTNNFLLGWFPFLVEGEEGQCAWFPPNQEMQWKGREYILQAKWRWRQTTIHADMSTENWLRAVVCFEENVKET